MKATLKDPRTAAAVFVVAVSLCFAANVGPSNRGAILSAAVTTPFATAPSMDCDIDCGEGDFYGCDPGEHNAWETVPAFMAWTRNGGVHLDDECRPYTCYVRHGPFCGYWEDTPDALESLRTSVLTGNVRTLAALVTAHPKEITLNVDRSAVQIVNCKGAVVAHLPVTPVFVNAVSSAVRAASH